MKIEILGMGCPKCEKLEANVLAAVKSANVEAQVLKIKEIDKIMGYGVMMTPALVVDGKVVSAGRVLSPEEIRKIISG